MSVFSTLWCLLSEHFIYLGKLYKMDRTEANILIIDDDLDVLVSAQMFLKQIFSLVKVEQRPDRIPELLSTIEFDVILLDMNFSKGKNDGEEGIHWLNQILQIHPDAIVIFITAYGGVDLAVQSLKSGAFDFIVKPWKNDKLLSIIFSALQLRKSKLELTKLKTTQQTITKDINQHFENFIGESPAIKRIFDLIQKVAKTDADIFIMGENGTGKELVAREIHKQSLRSEEDFISVDLGAIHENLFESELFGQVKGAFTDANTDKAGRIEIANGGTLFLDEIGNLAVPLQVKLLSVIQNRKVCRIGSNKEVPVDFRLICATNMPLYEMVKKGEFREDLLYRINMVEIPVPPLRNRTEDIPLLANYFLKKFTKRYHKEKLRISHSMLSKLQKYHWPGNIREFQHTLERAVILCEGNILKVSSISSDYSMQRPGKKDDNLNLEKMEKQYILRALSKNKGNVTKAAKDLGIARTALYRRLEKYGL